MRRSYQRKDEPRRLAFGIRAGALRSSGDLRVAARLTGGRFFLLLLGRGGALVELIDASGGIDQLLLTGEQRMARRADLDRDFGHRRTGRKGIAAGAVDPRLGMPFGVDLLFHSQMIISRLARAAGPEADGRGPQKPSPVKALASCFLASLGLTVAGPAFFALPVAAATPPPIAAPQSAQPAGASTPIPIPSGFALPGTGGGAPAPGVSATPSPPPGE